MSEIRTYLDEIGETTVGEKSARGRALFASRDRFVDILNGADRVSDAAGSFLATFGSAYSESMERDRHLVAGRTDLDESDVLYWAPFVNMLEWFPNGYRVEFGWIKSGDDDHFDQWGRQAFTVSGDATQLLDGIGRWADGLADDDSADFHESGERVDAGLRAERARKFRGKFEAFKQVHGVDGKCGRFLPGKGARFKRDDVRKRFDALRAAGKLDTGEGRKVAAELAEAERKVRSQVPVFVPANRSVRPFGSEAQWSKILGYGTDRQAIVVGDPATGWVVLDCFREAVSDSDTWEAMAGRAPARKFTRHLRNGMTRFSGPSLLVPAHLVGPFESPDDAEEAARAYAAQVKLDDDCDSDGYGDDGASDIPMDPFTALALREAEAAASDWISAQE